jgi:hypothetical protein
MLLERYFQFYLVSLGRAWYTWFRRNICLLRLKWVHPEFKPCVLISLDSSLDQPIQTMEQDCSWGADRCSFGPEIPILLCNPEMYYCVQKWLLVDAILNNLNPVMRVLFKINAFMVCTGIILLHVMPTSLLKDPCNISWHVSFFLVRVC